MNDHFLHIRKRRGGVSEPYQALYLSLYDDPRHNMAITYHQPDSMDNRDVNYREFGSEGTWLTETPIVKEFQNEDRTIHHAFLSGLSSDTEYEFTVGIPALSVPQRFRTLPDNLNDPINVVYGSDIHPYASVMSGVAEQMLSIMSQHDPYFFVLPGDFCDDDGNLQRSYRWTDFWRVLKGKFVDSQGRHIPLVTTFGNHEYHTGGLHNMSRIFWEDMFPFPDDEMITHGVIDIANYMSLFTFDNNFAGGGGTVEFNARRPSMSTVLDWLDTALTERSNVDFKIPIYHMPMFPSHRFHVGESSSYRHNLLQIFQDQDVRMMLTGHDHTFKITKEIVYDEGLGEPREITGEEAGFIEFGDGGLGNKFYGGDLIENWYVDKSGTSFSHITIIEFHGNQAKFDTYNINNQLIDTTIITI